MFGAIIGDLAGSVYEYPEFKDMMKGTINLERRLSVYDKEFLIDDQSFYSDDTILTIAILDSILNNASYEEKLKEYGQKYSNIELNRENYFKNWFSPGFIKWCKGNYQGISIGNGAMMRISPIGYLFNDLEEVKRQSRSATITSHNSSLAIMSAEIVSVVIFLAKNGYTRDEIERYLKKKYRIDLNYKLEGLQRNNIFDGSCNILNKCLYLTLYANNFEEAIRNSISIGGDTDTIACIVGSMAESLYGIDDIYKKKALKKLPENYQKKLLAGYKKTI